jgi:transcriptional regulator with XRE-family HTH domain
MTQETLAERVDRSRGLISQIESGETLLTEDMMYALADALRAPEPWDILRVNPLKEGDVVDITDILRGATPEVRAEIIGYARGKIGSK